MRFLDAAGQPLDGPPEWAPAFLDLERPIERWRDVRVLRDGHDLPVALRRLGGGPRLVAEWPRSNPGRYVVAIDVAGERETVELLVPPRKIGMPAFAHLLEDLETRLPTSIALALQRGGALAGARILPPAESTFAQEQLRLRRAVLGTDRRPGLLKTLDALARGPYRLLRTTELWVRTDRARRPHPARIALAVARSDNLDDRRLPRRVVDQRVEHTEDTYENRLVKAYADEVGARLRRLARALATTAPADAADAGALHARLERARRAASFLDAVAPLTQAPTHLTMVLRDNPPYRAALEGYLELHRSVAVRLDEPRLDAPLVNLPDLYQTWGTLLVLAALLEVAADAGYLVESQHLLRRDATGFFVRVLPDGRPAVELARAAPPTWAALVPERSFTTTGMYRSTTLTQRPDVTIEVRRPGQPPRLYLFDPKYKLDGEALEATTDESTTPGRPRKLDVDKMHAYRDAIRDAAGERVVALAAILYPGPPVPYADAGITALSAIPGPVASSAAELSTILARALA